ncbi:hypothetical protein [Solitalea lacus]|uniref:hypothetical protein n=1 Tax=Solitalea lacus TaxID=2911172 RepID=UPI001ED9D245|nr:hypothetical protein [Solitalea lacus]UKJ06183.1 hypothetical protein L2B55_11605 [Solitalea lacus]
MEPTGILAFSIDEYRGGMWQDGQTLLEDKLLKIMVRVEEAVIERNETWRINREYFAALEEIKRLEQEQLRLKQKELSDFKDKNLAC